ncbi:MAG: pbpA [Frankiales bacterium]|nr:pbpA [Frankiales bacterium]
MLVSPLLMASIAGAAAHGRLVAPSLVAGQQAAPGPAYPAALTAKMNSIMRATVAQDGATGRALADLPGNVEGKTGTAEFGTDVPPKSHSWFAGSRGDLAFAVFVYGGENSGTGAVPIAHSFLAAVPQ